LLGRVFFIHIAYGDDIVTQSRHLAHIGPAPAADADSGHVELRIRGNIFCAIQQTSRKNVEQRHAGASPMEKPPAIYFVPGEFYFCYAHFGNLVADSGIVIRQIHEADAERGSVSRSNFACREWVFKRHQPDPSTSRHGELPQEGAKNSKS